MATGFFTMSSDGTDTSVVTAGASDVLEGKVIVDKNGNPLTGTMPNRNTMTGATGINSSYSNVPTREGDNLQYCTDTKGTNRINIQPPKGYYCAGGSSYINRPASDFGNATRDKVSKDATFTSKDGLAISGSLVERGQAQYGNPVFTNDYLALNALPEGIYRSNGASQAPEARASLQSVTNAMGKAEISAYAVLGFNSSSRDQEMSNSQSFTMPRQGTVYYGGMSGSFDGRYGADVICRIYRNGSIVDSRDIDQNQDYNQRGTMYNKRFTANRGDTIKVECSLNNNGNTRAAFGCIQAVIIY